VGSLIQLISPEDFGGSSPPVMAHELSVPDIGPDDLVVQLDALIVLLWKAHQAYPDAGVRLSPTQHAV
jgi:hypothetical protein